MNFKKNRTVPRIYMDYAASAPKDDSLIKTIPHIPDAVAGANAGALHAEAVAARGYITEARKRVAVVVSAQPDEIIFTSGATESDNLAIFGSINHFLESGLLPETIEVIVSELEHPAVLNTLETLQKKGILVSTVSAPDGVVDPAAIHIKSGTKAALISVMYVHNELGTVQPIRDIAKRVRFLRKQNPEATIVFHTDATQAPLFFSLNTLQLGIDLMTIGSTKLYMQKGIGMLYKKRNVELSPIMIGGNQEFGLRPGTEPLELIHQFSYMLEFAQKSTEELFENIKNFQEYFEQKIQTEIPEAIVSCIGQERSPHISHIVIPNFDSELFVIELDARGIALSSQSACSDEEDPRGYVKNLTGRDNATLRFSFGRFTVKKDIDRAIDAVKEVLEKYEK